MQERWPGAGATMADGRWDVGSWGSAPCEGLQVCARESDGSPFLQAAGDGSRSQPRFYAELHADGGQQGAPAARGRCGAGPGPWGLGLQTLLSFPHGGGDPSGSVWCPAEAPQEGWCPLLCPHPRAASAGVRFEGTSGGHLVLPKPPAQGGSPSASSPVAVGRSLTGEAIFPRVWGHPSLPYARPVSQHPGAGGSAWVPAQPPASFAPCFAGGKVLRPDEGLAAGGGGGE